ncbi:hypothetical protein MJO28_000926 [Puccinia striiformis f. sp. tritici]|uniref:Uncharacterized protein n=1 Tax=Puccinia striiformis f. sp. tritici TaxID=168172 RepID=A0ACC0EZN0_9BASI|nr:hypothetical protein MJO28_000926 [Puccinia striiformis f. sp. tritici]
MNATRVQVLDTEGLRASLGVDYVFNRSKIYTSIDWNEEHKFRKFEVPLDINSVQATYEIQFGVVQRPTHKNTT